MKSVARLKHFIYKSFNANISEQRVSEKHDKSLDFLKQHFLSHAAQNFVNKGTSRNQNTRIGEGFQQEVSAMYKITNGKNAEHQV
jgi:hypothetical protein